jgi:hypothetical protein
LMSKITQIYDISSITDFDDVLVTRADC